MITSHQMGHLVKFENNEWIYADDNSTIDIDRPCVRCNLMPTIEGYDPCLGYLEGVIHACCGHGINNGYFMKENRETVDLGMLK